MGHVLGIDELHPMRKVLDFKVDGRMGRGRLNKMWKNTVEGDLRKVGLRKEDIPNRLMWRDSVRAIAARVR